MTDSNPRPNDEILQEALEQEPDLRDAYLREACGEDTERLAELRSLLAAHKRAGSFLDHAPVTESADDWVGTQVGSFELKRFLGAGGAGRVYEAERVSDDFQQRVAIKLLRTTLDREDDTRRFRIECEALSRLDHPSIARLIDAGFRDAAQPYLVMELVEGKTLREHCDEKRLGLRERLELFQQVCAAAEYAHQNLVIHRDLKPSNILVSDDGQVKLLDFGIAKLLSPGDEAGDHESTVTTQVRLTPRYASPEQLAGRPINTLSDVYSLGIVLYELLTGKPPYQLEGRTSREWERSVQSATIDHPSRVVDTDMSEAHGEALAALKRNLRGDLDNILLKALHREPGHRYRSPAEFAEDIQRHLEGSPVRARPDTLSYRVSKFVRRNRAAVIAAGLAVAALIGAAAVSTIAYFNVREAREESELQRTTAERSVEFLENMIASVDPDESQSPESITVLEMLEDSESRIETELADEPLVAARLQLTLGRSYQHLRSMEKAESALTNSVEVFTRELGDNDLRTLHAEAKLAEFLADKGELEAAEQRLASVVERLKTAPEDDRLESLALYADVLARQGEFEEAIERGTEAIGMARSIGSNEALMYALNNVGLALTRVGKPAESIEMLTEVVEICRRVRGPDHTETGQVTNNLGFALKQQGREEDARPYLEEALRIYQGVYEPNHTRIAIARANLGDVLMRAGDHEAAESHYRSAIQSFRTTLGDDHVNVGHVLNSLGLMFTFKEDFEQSYGPLRDAAQIYAATFGRDHPNVAAALHNLARSQRRAGARDEALRTGQEVWRIRNSVLPEDHPDIARSSEFMGRIMMDFDDPATARPWFERAVEIRRDTYEEDNPMRIDSERDLGRCLHALGEWAEAERLLEAAYRVCVARFGDEHEKTKSCEAELAAVREARANSE